MGFDESKLWVNVEKLQCCRIRRLRSGNPGDCLVFTVL